MTNRLMPASSWLEVPNNVHYGDERQRALTDCAEISNKPCIGFLIELLGGSIGRNQTMKS